MIDPRAPAGGEATTGARAHRSPFFYGWWIVGVAFVSMALNGALLFHAFGAYVVLWQADFGWSRTALSIAFALQRVESGLLGPIDGWLVDRFGPRRMMLIGVAIFGLGFMMLSRVNSLPTFYIAFLVIALGAALGSFLPSSVAIVNWFSRRRTSALAIAMLGLAAGGFLQPLVVAGLDTLGWRTMAFLSGLISMAVGLPLALLLRHRPQDYGWTADGDPAAAVAPATDGRQARPAAAGPPGELNFTPRQALATRAFWLIGVGHSLSLLVIGAVMVHFIAHVHESLGYSLTAAAMVITVMTAMQVVGQLTAGFLGDRLEKRYLIVAAMLMNSAALLVLATASSLWMVLAFAVLNGLGFGARIPLTTAIRADYFGSQYYGTISGMMSTVVTAGIIVGPLIAGASYDLTGSYVTGFTALGVVSALGSVFFVIVRKPDLPPAAEPGAATAAALPSVLAPALLASNRANNAGGDGAARAAALTARPAAAGDGAAPGPNGAPPRSSAATSGPRTPAHDYMGQGSPRTRDYMLAAEAAEAAEDRPAVAAPAETDSNDPAQAKRASHRGPPEDEGAGDG